MQNAGRSRDHIHDHLDGRCFLTPIVSLTRAWVISGEYQKHQHQRWLTASEHGRRGRQAADHPRSALRVVKAAEMTAQWPKAPKTDGGWGGGEER